MTPRAGMGGLVNTDYPEKWPVTFPVHGSLDSRKEGSR
jgi:hypothetical protein